MKVHIDDKTVEQIIKDLQEGGFEEHCRTGFLTGIMDGDDIYVDGIHVPEQDSKPSIAMISPENTMKAYETIRAIGKDVVGIGHYHGQFHVFESSLDQRMRLDLPKQGVPALALIANIKGDYQIFK